MRSAAPEREASRSRLIVGLLLMTLALAALLTWQAQMSTRYHRVAAEKALRDYAMLAADEFARRSANRLGYYGLYPLVTAVREDAARGLLPNPEQIRARRDERLPGDLVRSTFRSVSGRLDWLGPAPSAAQRTWISDSLAAASGSSALGDRPYFTAHIVLDGVSRSIVFGPAGQGAETPLAGLETDQRAFPVRFQAALDQGSLFPPSLAQGTVQNEALYLRVVDPAGREVFRSGTKREPYLGIERPFGEDYDGILNGFVVQAAVNPARASALVIGGLPRSRLPFLLGLLVLTAGLIATAVLQLRRERALSKLRSDFVSRVSHELRTPLAQIRLFAETLLLKRIRSEEERRRSLEIIDREARRLSNLVENVLRFSRGERGEDRVEAVPRDVVPLLRQLLIDFEPLLRGRGRLSASLPERLVARVDSDALAQMLLNLLDNAAKYGPEGGEIRVGALGDEQRITISVEDEGPGIPPAERERIWQRFYRLPRDRESAVAGTGIGLAVVRDLALLQGGRAWVEAAAGGGSRVVVELPGASSTTEVQPG